ncbi:MAG: hypothetical protein A2539_03285 [Elusimicrobia bacterium RIFOXYD2_FULL_34_15]|nr:MAG: hypothetical protein A2539_03285 [Elusimicrobia bacterium RIFOXYD2_FULL_34_15]
MKKRYKVISHTADVGIIAYGKTLSELFENAAYGMFSLITDIERVKEKGTIAISLQDNNLEELLIAFLNELQYYFSMKQLLFRKFEILSLTDTKLKASVTGEKISDHQVLHEIKAATYHNLKIKKIKNNYQVQIIFDV